MRYRWDTELHALVPASAPRRSERVELVLDSQYDGLRATDGTDISSKRKWKEYARLNNLTHADDFKQHWKKKARERARMAAGEEFDTRQRREDIAEAYRRVREGYRPRVQDADRGPDGDPTPVVEKFLFRR